MQPLAASAPVMRPNAQLASFSSVHYQPRPRSQRHHSCQQRQCFNRKKAVSLAFFHPPAKNQSWWFSASLQTCSLQLHSIWGSMRISHPATRDIMGDLQALPHPICRTILSPRVSVPTAALFSNSRFNLWIPGKL